MEKFITLTETAKILGIKEDEVNKLAEEGKIIAYRIGGNFLRFKLKDIEEYKRKNITSSLLEKKNKMREYSKYSWKEIVYDFFYYYDFYIIIILLIILLLIIIFKF
ncbi:MAG: helix-turn-helix domain-containing protein [Candidatus Omnitrophica bacterium]|nr:helix-turn-helix domain-containing protein [Candidatus Omnitrophota bacterium]